MIVLYSSCPEKMVIPAARLSTSIRRIPSGHFLSFTYLSSTVVFKSFCDSRDGIIKIFKEPRDRFQGIDSASLCSLASLHDNPIPTLFLAHIDCYKIKFQSPGIYFQRGGIDSRESIIGILQRLQIRAQRVRICKCLRTPGIDSPSLAESIPGLLKRLQIRAQHRVSGIRD